MKMIVTDLDGTLLKNDKTISDFTLSVFEECRKRGIITAIATARIEIGCKKYIDLLRPDVVITSDGALAKYKDNIIYGAEINGKSANKLISLLKNSAKDIVVATSSKCYWNSNNISKSAILHDAVYNDYSKPILEKIYKIRTSANSGDDIKIIAEKFADLQIVSYSGENLYSFLNPETSKIKAVKATAEYLKINIPEIAAFGDDFNDIEMLHQCGVGVAVFSAANEVKTAANYICESNENDGVAKWIKEHI